MSESHWMKCTPSTWWPFNPYSLIWSAHIQAQKSFMMNFDPRSGFFPLIIYFTSLRSRSGSDGGVIQTLSEVYDPWLSSFTRECQMQACNFSLDQLISSFFKSRFYHSKLKTFYRKSLKFCNFLFFCMPADDITVILRLVSQTIQNNSLTFQY